MIVGCLVQSFARSLLPVVPSLSPTYDSSLTQSSLDHFISNMAAALGDSSPSKKLKLVVFGATGRTGKEVVKQALEKGHHVTAVVRTPEKLTTQ